MTTEKEAVTKWCPFARAANVNKILSGVVAPAVNRIVNDHGGVVSSTNCIGSHCMAWRWTVSATSQTNTGHCGLAGKP